MTYVDVRRAALSAEGLSIIAEELDEEICRRGVRPKLIAGVALGGCALATGVSLYSRWAATTAFPMYDALYVRAEPKGHGTHKLVEGVFEKGDKVVLVEDVVTSGGSTLQALSSLREVGLDVVGVVAVLDREMGGLAHISAMCPATALVTLSELLGA